MKKAEPVKPGDLALVIKSPHFNPNSVSTLYGMTAMVVEIDDEPSLCGCPKFLMDRPISKQKTRHIEGCKLLKISPDAGQFEMQVENSRKVEA